MTRVKDLQSPAQVVADVRRRLEANADEIEAVITTAEREQRSDLSRREQARYDELLDAGQQLRDELVEAQVAERRSSPVPQINHGSGDADERPTTVLLGREQRISGRFRSEGRSGFGADEVRSFRHLGAPPSRARRPHAEI